MTQIYERERELQREIAGTISTAEPAVEVVAVELSGPERFCVYLDHPEGVDLELCERISGLLRGYLDRFTVDVSSPGLDRPLRTPEHFAKVTGRRVSVRTAHDIDGRKRFKGAVADAQGDAVALDLEEGRVEIPYAEVVRGNLIYEGR